MTCENTAEEISLKPHPGAGFYERHRGPKQTEVRENVYGGKIKINNDLVVPHLINGSSST